MTPTFYVDMKGGRLREVRCMKCNVHLYDFSNPIQMRDAVKSGLPKHTKVELSNGSYTDLISCKTCEFSNEDLPKMEATLKYGMMYEVVGAHKPKEFIHKLALFLRSFNIVRKI